jgi:uncharacterized RmlC-like cupin family protein
MARVDVARAANQPPAPGIATPGMDRRVGFDHDGVWTGTVTTTEGVVTGWHIHAGHDTYIYVVSGAATVESGPGGRDHVDASAGDFVLIPRGLIHREGTAAGSNGVHAVLVRVGEGELVTNVDGPEPD